MNSNWSYSPETPNLGQNRNFFRRLTLKLDGWPWKTIGHIFYATSSFVHHFVATGEFKLGLQSGNVQSGSNATIFLSHVTLKFDGCPWQTIGHLSQATSSCMHHFIIICELNWSYGPVTVKLSCDLCGLDLWSLTLTFCMDLTLAIDNNFYDDTMMGT